jgi:hypothetical protein
VATQPKHISVMTRICGKSSSTYSKAFRGRIVLPLKDKDGAPLLVPRHDNSLCPCGFTLTTKSNWIVLEAIASVIHGIEIAKT